MADKTPATAEKGEGNYKATRDYNERTERFLDEQGDRVDELAEEAAAALDGEDGDELRDAEDAAKARARS